MSTQTRPRLLKGILKGIIEVLIGFGNTDTDTDTIQYDEVVIVDPMLVEALNRIEGGMLKKEVETPPNPDSVSKKGRGGFTKKINSKTEQEMRKIYNNNKEKSIDTNTLGNEIVD